MAFRLQAETWPTTHHVRREEMQNEVQQPNRPKSGQKVVVFVARKPKPGRHCVVDGTGLGVTTTLYLQFEAWIIRIYQAVFRVDVRLSSISLVAAVQVRNCSINPFEILGQDSVGTCTKCLW